MHLERLSQRWEAEVGRLVPAAGRRRGAVLARLSLGIATAAHCSLARVGAVLSGRVQATSEERRFRRWLANERVDVTGIRDVITALVVGWQRGAPLWLALDETSQGTARGVDAAGKPTASCRFKVLSLRLLYRKRAIPLVWECHANAEADAAYADLIEQPLAEVAAHLPADARVVLLADRGLSWPALIRQRQGLGWSFLPRVQGQTRMRGADGVETALQDRVPAPGLAWMGAGAVFKKAGWLDANVVCVWRQGQGQRWLLVTDLAAEERRTAEYRARMWHEESFRDDKSHGFHWHQSRLTDPRRMERLLLALQFALLFILSRGLEAEAAGRRKRFGRTDRADLSLFTLGLRAFTHDLLHQRPIVVTLALPPPPSHHS